MLRFRPDLRLPARPDGHANRFHASQVQPDKGDRRDDKPLPAAGVLAVFELLVGISVPCDFAAEISTSPLVHLSLRPRLAGYLVGWLADESRWVGANPGCWLIGHRLLIRHANCFSGIRLGSTSLARVSGKRYARARLFCDCVRGYSCSYAEADQCQNGRCIRI
jgi:hypothetical protein